MIENDDKLLDGFYACINKLSASDKVIDDIHGELVKYKMGAGHFGLNEAVRQRVDVAPTEWWRRYGARTPNLQLIAIKILSLTCSSSGCERNQSTFEHIHSKKRNRFEHQMLQDLVFIKYSQNLKERFDSDDLIDLVVMEDDFDTRSLWLSGGEDETQPEPDNDMVFDGEDLSWLDVEIASGAAEPAINTMSQAALQKNAAAPPPPSSSRSKPKAKEVIVVDDEFDDGEYIGEDEEYEEDEEDASEEGRDDEDLTFNDL
ncbi:uncharacterized protein LOC131641396 [Vicia villosa]|uniref:uncharacterized protein LOC131641396 n=1 Tax=Vicia villosa TaxID=3911 RepID=UPI00273C72A3|nr:uncharacterized protein LOC131641396 [Vicia villosa]